jgi:hypothetical protein
LDNDKKVTNEVALTNETLANDDDLSLQCDSANPVGELIELTQKYAARPPIFTFGKEEGPPHNRKFFCSAQLGDMNETAAGQSKKIAKRLAALKLLAKLKENLNELLENKSNSEDTSSIAFSNFVEEKFAYSKKANFITLTQLKQSNNECMRLLQAVEIINEKEFDRVFFEKWVSEEDISYSLYRNPNKNSLGKIVALYYFILNKLNDQKIIIIVLLFLVVVSRSKSSYFEFKNGP